MNLDTKLEILNDAISPYDLYCNGYGNQGGNIQNYITAIILGSGVVPYRFNSHGSSIIDQTLAFDMAEVQNSNLGQINMITVSSFCGLHGLIWGYDIAEHSKVRQLHPLIKDLTVNNIYNNTEKIPVYSLVPLREASMKLFGTVAEKRFPLLPGSHVPCAQKNISVIGPNKIYAAMALGIAKNRDKDACLFMEDIGIEKKYFFNLVNRNNIKNILINLAESIVEVGKNQEVVFKEIFVDLIEQEVKKGEVGSALVAAPYFTLAKKAIPDNNFLNLINYNLDQWESALK